MGIYLHRGICSGTQTATGSGEDGRLAKIPPRQIIGGHPLSGSSLLLSPPIVKAYPHPLPPHAAAEQLI